MAIISPETNLGLVTPPMLGSPSHGSMVNHISDLLQTLFLLNQAKKPRIHAGILNVQVWFGNRATRSMRVDCQKPDGNRKLVWVLL